MTNKELAKNLYNIDWGSVQCDCQHENEKVTYLLSELETYSKEESLRIMIKVLEAVSLELKYPETDSPFKGLSDFNYLNKNIYNTSYYKVINRDKKLTELLSK